MESPYARRTRSLAVIGLHGRGQSVFSIRSIVESLGFADLEIVTPQAESGQWYPKSFLAPLYENEPWLTRSLESVERARKQLIDVGYPPAQIVLAGFSQGGALACEFVGRTSSQPIGGVIAWLAGRIGPPRTSWIECSALSGLQVFLSGSEEDEFVPGARTRETADHFAVRGAGVLCRVEPRPHIVDARDLAIALNVLQVVASKSRDPVTRVSNPI